jgi:nitrogen-specific signal transduction histidine kinase
VLNSVQVAKRVEVSATLNDHNQCRVAVVDDGPGIDPALADRLFDPFVTSKPEGMGLGLPLVRRAAEKLSGEVEWSRDKDRTRFVFTCQVAFPKSGLKNVIANAR